MYKDFEIIIEPNEEGGFYARIPDMPSIFTGGVTEIEALKNAKAAIKEYLEICKKDRLPIPQSKSGKFNVRVPKDLHRDLARKAAEQGV
ncbi:MAG: toxin-antitoxin system HicB family antitoxin, partial [Thermodesulfovibrionales bacterium]|nr:toxin-antitoxin system HicB family antitoxin [Thermodesulfovibrionales bacterium]